MKIITDKQSFIKAIAPIVYPGHTPRSAKNNLNKRLNRAIQRGELVLIGNQSDVNSLMFWAQCVWPTEIHNNFDIPIQATMQADFPQITSNIYAVNTPHPPLIMRS